MVEYKLVKFCRFCKKRMVVDKSESKVNYCNDCQKKFGKELQNGY